MKPSKMLPLALVALALSIASGCGTAPAAKAATATATSTGTTGTGESGGVGLDGSYDPCGGDPDCDPCWYHPDECYPVTEITGAAQGGTAKAPTLSKDLAKETTARNAGRAAALQAHEAAKAALAAHMKALPVPSLPDLTNPLKMGTSGIDAIVWARRKTQLEAEVERTSRGLLIGG